MATTALLIVKSTRSKFGISSSFSGGIVRGGGTGVGGGGGVSVDGGDDDDDNDDGGVGVFAASALFSFLRLLAPNPPLSFL